MADVQRHALPRRFFPRPHHNVMSERSLPLHLMTFVSFSGRHRRTLWLMLSGIFIAIITTGQWFSPNRLIAGGDNFTPALIDPLKALDHMRYAWDLSSTGAPNSLIELLPMIVLNLVLRMFFSVGDAQHALYTVFFAGQFLAMSFFVLALFPGRYVAAATASMFYCFNAFVIYVPPGYIGAFLLAYLPLMGGVFLRVATQRLSLPKLALFALISGMSGILFVNPPLYALLLLFALIMTAYVLGSNVRKDPKVLGRVALMAVLFVAANGYWMVQSYFVLFGAGHAQVVVGAVQAQSYGFVARRSSILNVFWLNSSWAWPTYYPFATAYNTPLLLLLTYAPALLAFSALLDRSITRRAAVPMTAVALLTLLASTGLHGPDPLANINTFLYAHVPLYWLFREPNSKFPFLTILLFAPLIGYQVERAATALVAFVARKRRRLAQAVKMSVVLIVTVGLVSTGFPLITGQVVGRTFASSVQTGAILPSYWFGLKNYLANVDPHSSVLVLPNDIFYQVQYNWGYYGADVIAPEFLPNPVVPLMAAGGYTVPTVSSVDIGGSLLHVLSNSAHPSMLPFLQAESIRYIVERNDIIPGGPTVLSRATVRAYMQVQPYIHFIRAFGKLDLYQVDDQDYLPPLFTLGLPQKPVMPGAVQVNEDFIRAFSLGNTTKLLPSLQRRGVTRVSYTRLTPVRYEVHVSNAKIGRPLLLGFLTAYNPNWHACMLPRGQSVHPWTCWSGGLQASQHIDLLGQFNGWLLNRAGSYTVVVDLGTQHATDIVALGSLVVVGGLLVAATAAVPLRRRRVSLHQRSPGAAGPPTA